MAKLKYDEAAILQIENLRRAGMKLTAIAKRFGVSRSTLQGALRAGRERLGDVAPEDRDTVSSQAPSKAAEARVQKHVEDIEREHGPHRRWPNFIAKKGSGTIAGDTGATRAATAQESR